MEIRYRDENGLDTKILVSASTSGLGFCFEATILASTSIVWSRLTFNMQQLWRPEVARPGNFVSNFCGFFGKTTPYGKIFKIMFRKFTWRHRLTLLCSNVIKFVRLEIGVIVRYLGLPHKKNKKIRLPLKLSLQCGSRLNSVRASPTIWLILFQISSKSVHFRWSYSWTR